MYQDTVPNLHPWQVLEFEKKVRLVGDGSVGKTAPVRRFVIDKFDDKSFITIGTKTSRRPMEFNLPAAGVNIKLNLDIGALLGHEGMERVHRKDSKGAEPGSKAPAPPRPAASAAAE